MMNKLIQKTCIIILLDLAFLCSAEAAKLADQEKMRAQLISVIDEERLKKQYYPLLLSGAGQEKTPQQIVDLFAQSTETFLSTMSPEGSKLVRVQIVPYIPFFIRAILPNDPQEANLAIEIQTRTNRPPRTIPTQNP